MISGRLQQLLGSNIYTSGLAYSRQRRVLDFHHEADGTLVSTVRGSSPTPYRQSIKVRLGKDGKIGAVAGRCSCPMTYNCKHVAAVLISAAVEPVAAVAVAPAPVLSPLLAGWLSRVRAADQAAPEADSGYPEDTTERLVYVLGEEPRGKLSATPMRVSLRKDGTFNKTLRRYNPHGYGSATHNAPAFVRPEDLPIMRLLDRLGLNPASYPGTVAKPESGEIMRVLESIAATGRGYWQDQFGPPLKLGLQRSGRFAWRALADGQQVLEIQDETGAALRPLPIDPPGWIDPATGSFGELSLDGPAALVKALMTAPPVPPEAAAAVAVALGGLKLARPPAPAVVTVQTRLGLAPTPVLRLFALAASRSALSWKPGSGRNSEPRMVTKDEILGALRLTFDYEGCILPAHPREDHRFREDDVTIVLRRDFKAEDAALRALNAAGAVDADHRAEFYYHQKKQVGDRVFAGDDDDLTDKRDFGRIDELSEFFGRATVDIAMAFMTETLPGLRRAGWRVEVAPDWPYRLHEGPVNIRASTDADDNGWFSFALALDADGNRVDLAPLIQRVIAALPVDAAGALPPGFDIAAFLENQAFYSRLHDGAYVSLDPAMLAPIIRVFFDAQGLLLGYHPAEAGRLHLAVEALAGCGIPFDGGSALLELGGKLRALAAMPFAEPPEQLTATLRPYQKSGFGWLRALADTGFGGVLADDMGLGKTVQTLALLVECHLARASDRPSLLIVPTTLIGTWVREARRFAPDLKVLVLHGAERHGRFASIADHHVAITTYPLLRRDHEKLFHQPWQAVILDEAHAVKNPASNAAKCIRKANARFRLALTGTPMENNLEDIWSLFDWLIPGLLGDRKTFKRLFRNPIEQSGNAAAQALLNGRIRPFILRRSKSEVAVDLPRKTEIIEMVGLGEDQRALYESIRLSMDARVREAIAAKGLAASRITILAALLKLRQVCCDPALLKQAEGTITTDSAKREHLMEMLESLIAEGRRVVVFSQFVGMLRLIETEVQARGWGYEWLTGDTQDRDGAVARFQAGATPLFLISLKAGGTGLTLTAADTVILYDPWWNPAVERQAMDRVHRIGQDRPVFIYRLVAEGAVEEAILKLQEKKQALADALFEGAASGPMGLGEDDIALLFRPLSQA